MLAIVEHRLRVLAWQKSEDGQKGRNQPAPMEPPESRIVTSRQQSALERRAEKYLRRQRDRGGAE